MTPMEAEEVQALYAGVERIMDTLDENGGKVGGCKHGVYLFYDYDGEPIYVGQTKEQLRTRIRRHLTNQRTDAVAMRVLDPFEVAEIEMWPYWDLGSASDNTVTNTLNRAEYTVNQLALTASAFNMVLNEAEIAPAPLIELPPSGARSCRRQRDETGSTPTFGSPDALAPLPSWLASSVSGR